MSVLDLPPEQASRLAPLGEPVAEFGPGFGHYLGQVILMVGSLLLGLGFLALAIVPFCLPGGRVVWAAHALKALIAGIALCGVGIRTGVQLRRARGLRVFVFPDALARVQGERTDIVFWKDVLTVHRASFTSSERGHSAKPARKLTIGTGDGWALEFDETIGDLRQLRELVEQNTLEHLLHPALDAYEAGQVLVFGPLQVSREGLNRGAKALPWDQYAGARITQGELIVSASGARRPFCRLLLRDVPNVHVFVALAEYITRFKP
jgi:hypothetical protein